VTPAVRQRIPLVIRNSRRPGVEGTRITSDAPACSNPVKAIACKADLTVFEIHPNDQRDSEGLAVSLGQMCGRYGTPAEFLCQNNGTIFLAFKSSTRYQNLPIELAGCVEVRLHPRSAILTLVGEGMVSSEIAARAVSALKQIPVTILSGGASNLAVSLMVPLTEMQRSVEMLHREFFQQVDSTVFAECPEPGLETLQPVLTPKPGDSAAATARRFRPLRIVCQN
jgi:aspartate kinase